MAVSPETQAYLPKILCAEQRLEQRVHVTCCTLVLQTNETGLLLGVVAVGTRHQECDSVWTEVDCRT